MPHRPRYLRLALLALLLTGAPTGGAATRAQVTVVGSSTVYPFAAAVADDYSAVSEGVDLSEGD